MEINAAESKTVNQVIKKFKIEGCFAIVQKITDGLINETYKISTPDLSTPDYILQKINIDIFPDIEALTSNKLLVSNALQGKSQSIQFVPTIDGKYYYTDEQNNSWQTSVFIPNSQVLSKPIDTDVAFEAGKSIGYFHKNTIEVNPKDLAITLPNFHNLKSRLKGFEESIKKDSSSRLKTVLHEVDFIKHQIQKLLYIDNLIEEGSLPLRVVHYDTKLSNILFNDSNKAICLIDYDTIMPGTWIFDFGDAVRSICNTCEEDEKNINNVSFDLKLYEALHSGYLHETKNIISEAERLNLLAGAQYIIIEQALRFLKDYLDGDKYYKIDYPDHNLQRTKVQLKLFKSLVSSFNS